ncbi:ABC-three component system protein [Micromonospora sp. CPCC 205546]|uniref:ABC-three component system protein n=1 Tax=Micromonospora sp. CPCC 205546 TaxID=3122397 RepID=UPI002FEFEFBF
MLELLHFLLGGSSDTGSLTAHRKIRDIEFQLHLDWPGVADGIRVSRSGARQGSVRVEPAPPGAATAQLLSGAGELRLAEWQRLIERDLFALPEEHVGISGRIMLSFLMRRVGSHAFNNPTHSHARQADAEGTTNLAYLLGLDWQLAGRYRELQAREKTRRELRKAASDPILGRIVGKASDLRGQIAVVEHRVNELQQQIDAFRVVPEYENLRIRADEIDRRIREMRNQDAVDRRNLNDLERAVEEAVSPDIDYLEPIYAELGIVLTDQVRRSFADVEAFHHSIVRNRRRYLDDEITTLRTRLADREAERNTLGNRLAEVLQTLREGGALDALTTLQRILAQEQALLGALQHRFEAAQAVEASRREITQTRVALQQEMETDIEERRHVVNQAVVLFSEYAQRLYSPDREAYLRFEPGDASLQIKPHIASDSSGGISSMVIFCFDLTVAVLAHRAGRAPDFLVHDSHLFDGVDERQFVRALSLSAEVCEQENLQYIVTLNSDELEKAVRLGFDPANHVLEPRLTDAFDDGGLFGFRF